MSEIEINGFVYDDSVLTSEETAREFRQAIREEKAELKTTTDPKRRHALAYSNWMRSRNSGRFEHYGIQQRQELHEIAFISNGRLVCSCGLIAGKPAGGLDEKIFLWNSRGHIHVAKRSRVTVFAVSVLLSKEAGARLHYWCENCGDLGEASTRVCGKVSGTGLRETRANHECSVVK